MNNVMNYIEYWMRQGFGTPLILIVMISMMMLPLPPFLLDIFFTFNIALSLVVLLAVIYSERPLDFAVFPTVILVATLLRLALNVASTRVVLLNGHNGTDAAGQVIKSFGEVVIGGNYTVGIVVFIILVVINFVVVTKGAGRVSEVSARFTLDALPGKQMAIDADLNAGLINQEQAIKRRTEVAQEADFYGSMDGASKFVRGDAIAGILVLIINIVGGLIIGVFQYNMNLSDAVHNYILLTVGDGLVAQVPSLLLSTAAAIIVTRVSSAQNMGQAVISQVFAKPRSLVIAAAIIGLIGIIPGMPHIAFILLSGGLAGIAYLFIKQEKVRREKQDTEQNEFSQVSDSKVSELSWDDVNPVDVIGLEVGYRLIPMVDNAQGGILLSRIKGVRKKISQELGFLIPSVHVRDNLDLKPNHYRLSLAGVIMGESMIHPDKWLAINPGQVFGDLEGIPTRDPAFGMDAVWISESQKEQAHTLGYTVVDASTVVATHLSMILEQNSQQLLGYEETQQLLDKLSLSSPKLVKELVPDGLSLGMVSKVLQGLLSEHIPLTDIRTIVETLAEYASKSKDTEYLISQVRIALSRLITQKISGLNEELPIITLKPELEQLLHSTIQNSGHGGISFEPGMADKIQQALVQFAAQQQAKQESSVLVVQPSIRTVLARFVRTISNDFHVLSYQEIPDNKQIRIIGTVG
ncbi:flagellar biosynthesis protein FlhA [Legionella pneumophila]|uniref:Flagellar biosynthesis protein FlhA n=1 Tax=Legionella pneumophila subsp. pascullei TaxID=91890 RepID=A0AAX2IVT8_LEGPN|nr:flagellar biosynthesis protein FlhA [Legionella pneumophila]AMP89571.1 flagellar biosynthesis protein FlhA [Legionella pneumophila subsp. pascullei]AMP92763.1 flagellar biosynthesis protein FlhA [Legionella pneumophila subsp. pascullei]AMP95729.1 flagellar biosynthesis protein FlhA [Legionella pneumophila subsp. pascullei]SQG90641.1 flagellar biosynthesis protein FlhA [Legionella pneumophila subsp. pascullei]VEH07186.1 flagellar biosynthesis protein FlhA [Legionella pneumophila subsp. pascu